MVVRVQKFNSVMSLLPLHPTLVLSFPCPHKELCDYAFTAPTLLMLPELAASALSLNYGFGLTTIVRKGFRGSTTFLSCVYYQVEKANSFFFSSALHLSVQLLSLMHPPSSVLTLQLHFVGVCPSRAICFLPLLRTSLTDWLNTSWSSQSHTFQRWQFNFQTPSFFDSKNARLCIVMAKIKLFPFISQSWTAVWRLFFFIKTQKIIS